MIFLKLFLICMFNDPNLAENLTNWAENLYLNYYLNLEFVFSSLLTGKFEEAKHLFVHSSKFSVDGFCIQ